mmetsp:Transcript_8118/g.10499  ORF Transcript_8118/g.10499 Transcript_8118/m.10499 type:complete len:378 (-) Transcript_8118:168-1301(-)
MSTNGSKNELFPSMATDPSSNVHLFAEPSIILNGHLYAAASPIQFCLYPDYQYQNVLLLREVYLNNSNHQEEEGQLGQIFWASNEIPQEYYNASIKNNIVGFKDMDNETQSILEPFLNNPEKVSPCDPSQEFTTKCEWCENGCQITDYPAPLENERCHYIVPRNKSSISSVLNDKDEEEAVEEDDESEIDSQVDVILYRSRIAGEVNHLYTGTRNGTSSDWSNITETNIADDVSNINAGNLPDGRVYLVSNAMVNVVRDPLYVSISEDGYKFDSTYVVASCEMDVFKSSRSKISPSSREEEEKEDDDEHMGNTNDDESLQGERWGCAKRYSGGSKQGGVQYPQAIAMTEASGEAAGFWVIFSLNKEDIWIAKVPLTF